MRQGEKILLKEEEMQEKMQVQRKKRVAKGI